MARVSHALLAALALALAACQLPGGSPGAPGRARAILAYTGANEFALVRDTAVARRADGDFATAQAQFTADGRYAFATEGGAHLMAIDTQSSELRAFPVAAHHPVAEDRSAVVWFEAPDRLMRLDLAAENPQPELRQEIHLPDTTAETTAADTEVQVLGASFGGVLLARTECPCGDDDDRGRLYLVGSDRAVQDLGIPAAGAIAAPQLSADDGRLAYAVNGAATTVVQVDLVSGIVSTSTVADGGAPITHLWWGEVGSLFAAAAHDDRPPGIWKHGAGGWARVDPGPLLETRALRSGATAVLVPAADSTRTGTLAIDADGQRTELATGVATLALQPG